MMRPLTRPRHQRQGAILIVVMVLLALFAVLALSFVLYAESMATGSRIYREDRSRLAPPDASVAANEYLRQLIYPLRDDGPDTLSPLRGHEMARLMYGGLPLGSVPYNGVGAFSETFTQSLEGSGTSFTLNRSEILSYIPRRDRFGVSANNFIVDPEYTNQAAPGTPLRVGASYGSNLATSTAVYMGKNAPYTYPDRNNAAIGMVRPDVPGDVIVSSYHRAQLFGSLDPTNAAWYTSSGRFRSVRPRPYDHIIASDLPAVQTALNAAGVWPIPENPTLAQITDIRNAIASYTSFPYPAPNADGTVTGDVQNWKFTEGVQKNDSVWVYPNNPVFNWRGRKVAACVAPLVIPLDGRIPINVAGNFAASSNHGFGPWEIGMSNSLSNSADVNTLLQSRNGLGAVTTVPGSTMITRTFDSTLSTTGATVTRFPQSYSKIDWNGSQSSGPEPHSFPITTNPTPQRMMMPGDSSPKLFVTAPVWPDYTYNDGTAKPGPYSTGPNFNIGSDGSTSTVGTDTEDETLRHPSLWNPYMHTIQKLGGSGPGLFPVTDCRRVFGRYSDRVVHNGTAYLTNSPSYAYNNNGPNSGSVSRRMLMTLISNSLKRPYVSPNFYDPAATPFTLAISTTVPTAVPPTFTMPAAIGTTPTGSVDMAYTNIIRNERAAIGGVDVNRPIADYRVDMALPLTPSNVTVATAAEADRDRQHLAWDIFARLVIVTGASASVTLDSTPVTFGQPSNIRITPRAGQSVAETDGLRWLAQLAANMVDYIDNDDISTAFVWNPIDPLDPRNPANFATAADISNRVVYGVEKPRLVLNEAYSEITNHPSDWSGTKANNPFRVRFFIEMLNAGTQELPTSPLGAGTTPGSVPLRNTPASTGTEQSVYQIQVFDNPTQVATDLAANSNVLGTVTGAAAKLSPNFLTSKVVASATADSAWVEPNDGSFKFDLPASPNRAGFAVFGPEDPGATADAISFSPNAAAAPYSYMIQSKKPAAASPSDLEYEVPNCPQASIDNTAAPTSVVVNGTPVPQHAILLQRLANPYLAVDTMNQYITVDMLANVPINDSIRLGSDATGADRTNPSVPAKLDPKNHPSASRVQPYASSATSVVQGMNLDNASAPLSHQLSLFRHNYSLDPTVNPIPTAPLTANATLAMPFDWIVHPDRKVINSAELLHVSAVRPYEYTREIAPSSHRHSLLSRLPQAPVLARSLEMMSVKPWMYNIPDGGRVPGKVNLNMVQSVNVFTDLADPQPVNFFNSGMVNAAWGGIVAGRGSYSPTNEEGGADRPFKSFGSASFVTNASGVVSNPYSDSLLRPAPNGLGMASTSPYLQQELLRKTQNNLTTVSDTYLVLMTIGFFEVREGDPSDINNPPVLGKELYDQVPGDLRSQYYAVIDRSNLAYDYDATTGQPIARQATNIWNSELVQGPLPTNAAGVSFLRFPAAVTNSGATISFNYDGRNVTLDPSNILYDKLRIGTGANAETIQIQPFTPVTDSAGVTYNSYDATSGLVTVAFNSAMLKYKHHPGEPVGSNTEFGNPGPQLDFNANSSPVVRAFGRVDY